MLGLTAPVHPLSGKFGFLVVTMQDFLRDWHRWTKAERVIALAVIALMLVGVPAALAMHGLS
jgi:hypothetical protein